MAVLQFGCLLFENGWNKQSSQSSVHEYIVADVLSRPQFNVNKNEFTR